MRKVIDLYSVRQIYFDFLLYFIHIKGFIYTLLSTNIDVFLQKFFRMTIHKEGYPTIIVLALLAFISSEMSYLYLSTLGFVIVLCTVLTILGIVLFFFRNPIRRERYTDDNGVISPADGTVVVLEKVMESEFFNEERIQLSIFMSLYNVHKNFFPVSGEVSYYKHHS